MALRYDLPRVPSNDKPSFWNHDTAKWGLIGNLAGGMLAGLIGATALFSGAGLLAGAAFLLTPVFTLGGAYIGANYGAKIGMAKQVREMHEGRVVSDPTYWNKGIVTGWALGAAVTLALFIVGVPTGGFGLIGAIAGSVMHKNTLQKDFDLATAQAAYNQSQVRVRTQEQGLSQDIAQYKDSVSLEETQALEARQNARQAGSSHAQTITNQEMQPSEIGR